MTDLVRKLLGLADQLDRVGTRDPVRPYVPLQKCDAVTIRHGALTIQKLHAEIAGLKADVLRLTAQNTPRKTG